MKTLIDIKQCLEEHQAHKKEGQEGTYAMRNLNHAMWDHALSEFLKGNYTEQQLTDLTSQLILHFYQNRNNMRGFADSFQIKAYLWILEKSLDDFEKILHIEIK